LLLWYQGFIQSFVAQSIFDLIRSTMNILVNLFEVMLLVRLSGSIHQYLQIAEYDGHGGFIRDYELPWYEDWNLPAFIHHSALWDALSTRTSPSTCIIPVLGLKTART